VHQGVNAGFVTFVTIDLPIAVTYEAGETAEIPSQTVLKINPMSGPILKL
jgi:hypothetical protein